jgi:hypothetical protein
MQMRLSLLCAAILLGLTFASGQTGSPATSKAAPANDEATLAHDRHDGLDLSADPYTDAERAKTKFGKADPIPAGILPVEIFLRNELDQPIRIDLSTIQLEVHPPEGNRQEIDSLSTEQVANAIVHPEGPPAPTTRRFPPIGIPTGGKDKKVQSMEQSLQPLALDADVVPPMGMIHGFLFFNLSHQISLAQNASLYIPDAMVVPSNKALMFFEVSLQPAPGR